MSTNLNYELILHKGVELDPTYIMYIIDVIVDFEVIMTGYTVTINSNEKIFRKSKIVVNEYYIPDIKLKEVFT